MRHTWPVLLCAACGGDDAHAPIDAAPAIDAPLAGNYRETCDGSGVIALDATHFLAVNDEDQVLRIYTRGSDAPPIEQFDITGAIGLVPGDEADLEDLARIGDRVYAITSHGRTSTSGELRPARYRFAAFDLAGNVPALSITVAGSSEHVLADMLDAANWDAPDRAVLDSLAAASQLDDDSEPTLAPEDRGTNIEALAALPGGGLAIGFRNPRPGGLAIVVTLTNPDAVVAGATAHFGSATQLDLGGLGVRGMTRSSTGDAVFAIAGSHAGGGGFALYRWSGVAGAPAERVVELAAPADSAPEAVAAYPGAADLQIVFDQGDATIAGASCKDTPAANRRFGDTTVRVP